MCQVIDPPQDPRGGLYAPNITGGVEPNDSISYIVRRLMNPTWTEFNPENSTHTLHIAQAVGIMGNDHFEDFHCEDSLRRRLRQDDAICAQLQAEVVAGRLNLKIFNWLKSSEDTITLHASEFPQQEDPCEYYSTVFAST
jgi:hypothetical protein